VAGENTRDWGRDETPTKEGAMSEQPYEKWLREQQQAAGETTAAATDMSEDAAFEAFAEQSGMNDMLGRTPASGASADLSAQDGGQVETTDAGEEAMWQAFVEQSGASWMLGEMGGGARADLSDDGQDDALPRQEAEQEELHRSLREQNGLDAGDGSGASDEEAWAQYQAALGQS